MSLSIAAAAQAAERPSIVVGNVNGWEIKDNHGTCSAWTAYEGDRLIMVEYDFGRDSARFVVADPAWRSVEHAQTYQVRIAFSNGSEYPSGPATGLRIDREPEITTGLYFDMDGDDFLYDFAAAGAVALYMEEFRLGTFNLGGTRAMVARLRSCAVDTYRRFPPDPFASIRPRGSSTTEPARARTNLSSYISSDDYPASALRAGEQGSTFFRLTVGPDGRVTDCVVTGSSGSAALDTATCRILRSRARFTPARDSRGNPTVDTYSSSIRWRLDDPPAVPTPTDPPH